MPLWTRRNVTIRVIGGNATCVRTLHEETPVHQHRRRHRGVPHRRMDSPRRGPRARGRAGATATDEGRGATPFEPVDHDRFPDRKTRLAIEVARRMAGVFAHDICFVELAGVADERTVDDAVASALRLPTSGRSSIEVIVDFLRDKTMLLVLDNCEHLVKACARLVERLCHEAAGLTVLTTSRMPLHLEVEHVVRLEPFATPELSGTKQLTVADSLSFDSIQLFTNRAAQSLLNFKLTDANVSVVAHICQQLDGIPLAIEIAAAQGKKTRGLERDFCVRQKHRCHPPRLGFRT